MATVFPVDPELAEGRRVTFDPDEPFHSHTSVGAEEILPGSAGGVERDGEHPCEGQQDLARPRMTEPENEDILRASAGNKRAAAARSLQEPGLREMCQRLLNRAKADREDFGHRGLRGQPLS